MPNFIMQAKAEVFYGVRIRIPRRMNWEATIAHIQSEKYLSQMATLVSSASSLSPPASKVPKQDVKTTVTMTGFFVTRPDDYDDSEVDYIQYEQGEEKMALAGQKLLDKIFDDNAHGLAFRLRASSGQDGDYQGDDDPDQEEDDEIYHKNTALYLVDQASCSALDNRKKRVHVDGSVWTNLPWCLHSQRIPTHAPSPETIQKIQFVVQSLGLQVQQENESGDGGDGKEAGPGWYFCSSASYSED